MDFIANREEQNRLMLETLGLARVEELFNAIPEALRCRAPATDDGLSEYEVLQYLEKLASVNTYSGFDNYLGGGAYEHHIPSIVGAICSKSEFLTAYTPYQPEMSQGMLQAIFEYQSAICALTGLDVSNASVYDGAAACAEAILMAMRQHPQRKKIVLAASLHPHYRAVVDQYLRSHSVEVVTLSYLADGTLDLQYLNETVDDQTAAVLIQSPNFFGVVEPLKEAFALNSKHKGISILCANPLSFGLYATAADVGADIAVGDTQPFGLPLSFGGPYVGYMAARQELLRQLPGRIVGETVDSLGARGFVLTLQAREQHIRREKATSNICTNQALAALASLVAISWYGPRGIVDLASTNYQRASYLRSHLADVPGIRLMSTGPIFNEFVVFFNRPLSKVLRHFRKEGIEPGLELKRFYPEFKEGLLIAVTETKSLRQLDDYVDVAKEAVYD